MNVTGPQGGSEGFDRLDGKILRNVREFWETVDPVPATLVERIRFAVQLDEAETAVPRMDEFSLLSANRGDELSRIYTFGCCAFTMMMKVSARSEGAVRVDGWLCPPVRLPIEMRTAAGVVATTADADGRFALHDVPAGTAQLVVRSTDQVYTVMVPAEDP